MARAATISPVYAAPVPMPAKPDSVIGVSMTRLSPNSSSSPLVILYAPWYCATSSPMTKTSWLRRISSASASFSACRTVICAAERALGVGAGS